MSTRPLAPSVSIPSVTQAIPIEVGNEYLAMARTGARDSAAMGAVLVAIGTPVAIDAAEANLVSGLTSGKFDLRQLVLHGIVLANAGHIAQAQAAIVHAIALGYVQFGGLLAPAVEILVALRNAQGDEKGVAALERDGIELGGQLQTYRTLPPYSIATVPNEPSNAAQFRRMNNLLVEAARRLPMNPVDSATIASLAYDNTVGKHGGRPEDFVALERLGAVILDAAVQPTFDVQTWLGEPGPMRDELTMKVGQAVRNLFGLALAQRVKILEGQSRTPFDEAFVQQLDNVRPFLTTPAGLDTCTALLTVISRNLRGRNGG